MKQTERFLSLGSRILISTLVPVVVSFALIITVIFISLNNYSEDTAKDKLLQISRKYTYNFENKIHNALNYLSITASKLEMQIEMKNTDRK